MGITIKRRFYLEASYISYQTSPDSIDFIPVVIGFQFLTRRDVAGRHAKERSNHSTSQ
jgi:hypothetical protein